MTTFVKNNKSLISPNQCAIEAIAPQGLKLICGDADLESQKAQIILYGLAEACKKKR